MEKVRREKMQVHEKGSRETLCFSSVLWLGGSKSRLAKAAGAEPAGQVKDEKLHSIVVRSTFGSKKWQKLTALEHFWKLRC